MTSYLSNIFGKTGQALLQLFITGEVLTLESVEACLHARVRASTKDIFQAMDGKISLTDRRLLDDSLDEYQFYTRKIKKIEHDIEQYILSHFPLEYELLQSIPGVKQHSAAIILAEIGPSIEAFRTASHLASWAGLSPGSYESAGKKKSSRVTRGNKYLKTALITSGGMAGRSRDPAFKLLYHSLHSRVNYNEECKKH